jgi:hypothetical protein
MAKTDWNSISLGIGIDFLIIGLAIGEVTIPTSKSSYTSIYSSYNKCFSYFDGDSIGDK